MFNALIVFYLVFILIMLAIPVAAYVFSALGLSRMARSCGLKSPYLAWIPIGDMYLVGSIAEISASRQGKKSMPYRKILPGLSAGAFAVLIAMIVVMCALIFSLPDTPESSDPDDFPSENVEFVSHSYDEPDTGFEIDGDDPYAEDSYEDYSEEDEVFAVLLMLVMMLFYFLFFAVAIVASVFQYIALWHVYKLFDESNAVLYLLLSIFVSISMPIIFFLLGRKVPDLPMYKAPVVPLPSGLSVAEISAAMAPAPSLAEPAPIAPESNDQV